MQTGNINNRIVNKYVKVLTLMTKSVCVLPGQDFLMVHFHQTPLFQADGTSKHKNDNDKMEQHNLSRIPLEQDQGSLLF